MPDKTIFLDISAEEGLKRIADRSFLDRLDQESIEFHRAVYEGYQEVVRRYPDRIICVDASRTPEEVIEDACRIIKEILDA